MLPLLLLLAALPATDDWPRLRGPNGDNVAREVPGDVAPEPLWRVDVGVGYSTPIVAGGRLFTVGYIPSEADPKVGIDRVLCFDARTGAEHWRVEYPSLAYANEHKGGVIGTPTAHGDVLLVASRQGELRALDVTSGELRWEVDLVERHGVEPGRYGFASNPLVDGERIVVNMQRAVALKLSSGETEWISEDLDANYSTAVPITLPAEDGAMVSGYACFGGNGVFALNAATGERLRHVVFKKGQRNVEGATPIVMGTRVFVSSGYDQGGALYEFDADPPKLLWRTRRMRTKLAGATLFDNHLYGHDESMLMCMDLEGQVRWRERGLGHGALSIAGGRLLVTTSEGELVVAAASPDGFEEASRVKLFDGGDFWATPVLVNGRVYVRGSRGDLACLDAHAAIAENGATPTPETAEAVTPAALEQSYLQRIGPGGPPLGLSLSGTLHVVALGLEDVAATWEHDETGRWHGSFDLPAGMDGTIHEVFDGTHAWTVDAYRGDKLLDDERTQELLRTRGLRDIFDPIPNGSEARYSGVVTFRGTHCHAVDVPLDEERTLRVFFDVESGLYVGRTAPGEATVVLGDWRRVPVDHDRTHGRTDLPSCLVPFRRTEFAADDGLESRWTFTSARLAGPKAEWFEIPESIQEALEAREQSGKDE